MQLGKTLIGAIIGAALGIGVLIVVYLQFGYDKMWMAIPVALLTGLCVRFVAARGGRASYARGALTVILALAAYLGGLQVTKAIATHRATITRNVAVHPDSGGAGGETPAAANPEAEPKTAPAGGAAPPTIANRKPPAPIDPSIRRPQLSQYPTWDLLALGIAALVAYELGRGSGNIAGSTASSVPSEPVPMGTHPDA